jgi:ABC-type Na+ transport system ATPase subunit NatA
MTADHEQVTSTDASAHAAAQLRRGANSTSRVEPGTGPVAGVTGRGSSVPAVRVEGVVKRFGATVALAGAGLEVPAGMVFGLLGPNGAGKTTLVRILATLLAPDAGRAEVFGHDVAGEPAAVRELIGLTGQFAAVDELLTGRENLEMFGRLFKLPGEQARRRAGELLERFDLAPAADRPARTYSGGMRRRLDIASSLVTRPQVLFLDEPTTGLDPRSRNEIWAVAPDVPAPHRPVLRPRLPPPQAVRSARRGRARCAGSGPQPVLGAATRCRGDGGGAVYRRTARKRGDKLMTPGRIIGVSSAAREGR